MGILDVFLLLGGLGLFLYGMEMMSEGLEKAAGNSLRTVLEKLTSNRILGVLVGVVVTCIIQSSSATTVMVVGFVNAGLMNLVQAIGIMMGANIGTTITAQIIAFKVDTIAPLILFVGVVMYMFIKHRNAKKIGYIIMGFGVLFMGLNLMGQGVAPLKTSEGFKNILISFQHPVLGLLVGLVFTAIIQSSSASIGVLQVFAAQGLITLESSIFIVLGMNIGTCITAVISSFGGSREGKRTAWCNVMIKALGALVYGTIMLIFPNIISWIASVSPDSASRQIANFHLFYNLASTVLLLPFAQHIVKLMTKILPETEAEKKAVRRLIFLDNTTLRTPSIAVGQAHREIMRMGGLAAENLRLSLDAFFEASVTKAEDVIQQETTIDYLSHEISSYLVKMRGINLPEADLEKVGMMFSVVSNIERIGDHAENVAEYAMMEGEHRAIISEDAMEELRELAGKTIEIVTACLEVYDSNETSRLSYIQDVEEDIDDLYDECIEHHIDRLVQNKCDPRGGVVFTDMCSDLERCADHSTNIAYALLGEPGGEG